METPREINGRAMLVDISPAKPYTIYRISETDRTENTDNPELETDYRLLYIKETQNSNQKVLGTETLKAPVLFVDNNRMEILYNDINNLVEKLQNDNKLKVIEASTATNDRELLELQEKYEINLEKIRVTCDLFHMLSSTGEKLLNNVTKEPVVGDSFTFFKPVGQDVNQAIRQQLRSKEFIEANEGSAGQTIKKIEEKPAETTTK